MIFPIELYFPLVQVTTNMSCVPEGHILKNCMIIILEICFDVEGLCTSENLSFLYCLLGLL